MTKTPRHDARFFGVEFDVEPEDEDADEVESEVAEVADADAEESDDELPDEVDCADVSEAAEFL